MTSSDFVDLLRRRFVLLVLTTLIGAGLGYLITPQLPRLYSTSATVLVTPGAGNLTALDAGQGLTSDQLAATYAQVLQSRTVVESALNAAGVTTGYDSAAPSLDVTPVRGTLLIQMTMRGTDPVAVALVLNQMVAATNQQTELTQQALLRTRREQLSALSDQLTQDAADVQTEVDAVLVQPQGVTRDDELARALARLTQAQQRVLAAANSIGEVDLAAASLFEPLTLLEPAEPPIGPVFPRALLTVVLGGSGGLVVGLLAVTLFELASDPVRTPSQVWRRTGAPVLALVSDGNGDEGFRRLRDALQLDLGGNPRTVLVISCDQREGKTTIALGLAEAWARAMQSVVLVDANWRAPRLHSLFGRPPEEPGFSALLQQDHVGTHAALTAADTEERLLVLTSGSPTVATGDLLSSPRLATRVQELAELADRVVLDGPSLLDAYALALGRSVGRVLLVVDARRTRLRTVQQGVERMHVAGALAIGVVLNHWPQGSRLASTLGAENGPRGAQQDHQVQGE